MECARAADFFYFLKGLPGVPCLGGVVTKAGFMFRANVLRRMAGACRTVENAGVLRNVQVAQVFSMKKKTGYAFGGRGCALWRRNSTHYVIVLMTSGTCFVDSLLSSKHLHPPQKQFDFSIGQNS